MTTRKLSAQSRGKIHKALEMLEKTTDDRPIYRITIRPDPFSLETPYEIDVSAIEFGQAIVANVETDLDEITSLLLWKSGDYPRYSVFDYEVTDLKTGKIVSTGNYDSLRDRLEASGLTLIEVGKYL